MAQRVNVVIVEATGESYDEKRRLFEMAQS